MKTKTDQEKRDKILKNLHLVAFTYNSTKGHRVWHVALLYNRGDLWAEGRAACCPADVITGLFDAEKGDELSLGRARLAARKGKTYGNLPGGFSKGAYFGPPLKRALTSLAPPVSLIPAVLGSLLAPNRKGWLRLNNGYFSHG